MRTTLFMVLAACLLSSCKKDSIEKSQFYGSWEIRSSIGFLSPDGSEHYKPGTAPILNSEGMELLTGTPTTNWSRRKVFKS